MRSQQPRRDVRREKAAEANRLFRMAYSRQLEGDLERAAGLYEKSIRLHPSAEAHVHLGWVKSTKGLVEEAMEHCRRAIELDPSFANPWNDIGAYLIAEDQAEESLFFLKRATRMKSYESRCFPHYNLHRAYLALGDRGRAIDHLHEALEADPDFSPAVAALYELLFPGQPAPEADEDLADCRRAGTPVLAAPMPRESRPRA